MMKLRNTDGKIIPEVRLLAYIVKLISYGKNEKQIIKIFHGDKQLVKTWIVTLMEIHFVTMNSSSEYVITPDGTDYLQKFNVHL